MLSLCFGSFIFAALSAAVLTWTVRNVAFAKGWAAPPASERHIHEHAIPRLGGVAVMATLAITSAIALFVARHLHLQHHFPLRIWLPIVSASLVSFALGFWDDVRGVRPWPKLAVLSISGVLLYAGHVRVQSFSGLFGSHQFGHVTSLLLTVGWVLFISNAFNLMDGLDGLAAGSALFATTTMFVVALVNGSAMTELLTAIMAGAILGFLRYNFNPATIFLGDCGSLFIGTMLAALSLSGVQQKSSTLVAVGIPLVAFGLPIVEASISVVRRFLSGKSIFIADREHIHHKLLDQGLTHRGAVLLLYSVSAIFGLLSLSLLLPGTGGVAIVLSIVAVVVVLGVQKLGYHEFGEVGRIARRTVEQKQIIINNLLIRRGTDKLKHCRTLAEVCVALEQTFSTNDMDGFVVTVYPSNEWAGWDHSWERCARPVPDAPAWRLVLDLWSNDLGIGKLVLVRYATAELLLDINLFSEFVVALSKACERGLAAQDSREKIWSEAV